MEEGFLETLSKNKRDGGKIRSKAEIIYDYDDSSIPYPLKPMIKLDYCYKLTLTMFKHSFVIAMPFSKITSYSLAMIYHILRHPTCWEYTFRTTPYRAILT